ncbi:MAG TPA: EF-Tu/IF-2/RF-3 family GTPase [Methanoregulaceae archaeon]|nr:EF-Tu/IF-2/RF-3 family GTPase [Methanoregulaceae archaeon]
MPNLNVAVIAPEGYAKDLGKKGTSSDITFYNVKRDDVTVTFIEPSRYPEKLPSLFFAVSMSDWAILVINEINPALGECILMLDQAGLKDGVIILHNYISPEEIAPLIRGTVAEHYEIIDEEMGRLREKFLEEAEKTRGRQREPGEKFTGSVPIDHYFDVKGIGPVILGGVARGCIRKHETLHILPTKKTAQIRSIQVHDDDAEVACTGERVGLAMKGIDTEDLDRGYVLSTDSSLISSSVINGRAELVRYWPSPLKEEMVIHIGHWLQFIPSRVAFVDNSGDWKKPEITLRSDKDLVYYPGEKALLHYLEGGKLRIVGSIRIS